MIEEGKPGEFPNRTLRETVIAAKVDRAREHPLKPFNEPAVMLPVTRQTEFCGPMFATSPDAIALCGAEPRFSPLFLGATFREFMDY